MPRYSDERRQAVVAKLRKKAAAIWGTRTND